MLNQQPTLDHVFHALADPTRRLLVERLCRGPASVSELAQPLDMSLPAVLQHLQVLESCALVRSEKVGRVRTCRVEPAVLRTAEQWITQRRASWERRLDRLGDYLAEQEAASPSVITITAPAAAPTAKRAASSAKRAAPTTPRAAPRATGTSRRKS